MDVAPTREHPTVSPSLVCEGGGKQPHPTVSKANADCHCISTRTPITDTWQTPASISVFQLCITARQTDTEAAPKITSLGTRVGAEPQPSREDETPSLLQLPSGWDVSNNSDCMYILPQSSPPSHAPDELLWSTVVAGQMFQEPQQPLLYNLLWLQIRSSCTCWWRGEA